jgi:Fe2+ or Zn2+ uptake regulation protein
MADILGSGAAPEAAHAESVRLLRDAGLRATPQRVLVLEALSANAGHVTADTLMRWVSARLPGINLATVYRTLEALTAAGLVTQTDLGAGAVHYELVGDAQHHHLVCQQCGALIEVPDAAFLPLFEQIKREFGFRPTSTHLAIFGVCPGCAQHAGRDGQR